MVIFGHQGLVFSFGIDGVGGGGGDSKMVIYGQVEVLVS